MNFNVNFDVLQSKYIVNLLVKIIKNTLINKPHSLRTTLIRNTTWHWFWLIQYVAQCLWHTRPLELLQQTNKYIKYCWRQLLSVNWLLYLPVQCQVVKTLDVHCHCYVCSAPGGHSVGCRTSWVCLQHHATVVISNGVTICGSKFPPTVSKHCQPQHSAIPKNHRSNVKYEQSQLLWYPRCCFLSPTSWQTFS